MENLKQNPFKANVIFQLKENTGKQPFRHVP